MEAFDRSALLIGDDNLKKLATKTVMVFGLGGVGSYVVEALARTNIGKLILVDFDVIDQTNINRQLYALNSTIGQQKTEVAKNRCLDINPNLLIETSEIFINHESINNIRFQDVDYIVDAVDTVSAKLLIIKEAFKYRIPIISSMGTGNKLDSSKIAITDLNKTINCPLARVMRNELRKLKITKLTVLASSELPQKINQIPLKDNSNKTIVASISYIPSIGGLMIAGKVIQDLIK